MIITVEIHRCPKCNSANITKNGHDYKDAQKFHCKACRAYGTLKPKRAYPDTQKELILRAYRERASMHGIKRIFGVARQTLARWLKTVAEALPDLVTTLILPQSNDVLELDELWSFVLKKTTNVGFGSPYADTHGKLGPSILVTGMKPVVANSGNASRIVINTVPLTVIAGRLIRKSLAVANINRWEKRADRRLMWSVGTIPYGSV